MLGIVSAIIAGVSIVLSFITRMTQIFIQKKMKECEAEKKKMNEKIIELEKTLKHICKKE